MSQPDWVMEMIERLEPDLREDWVHRSAHMEFDAGLSRDHAECLALLNVLRKYPAALLASYVESINTSLGDEDNE